MAGASFDTDLRTAAHMFDQIKAAGRNMRPLMAEIGSVLEDSTRQRFRTQRSPDNIPWAPISQEWREEKAARGFAGSILTMRGDLRNSVRFEADAHSASVIASSPYAAIHQFGGVIRPRRARALRVRGRFVSSVTMPARPYLGMSDEDRSEVLDAARDFLERAARR